MTSTHWIGATFDGATNDTYSLVFIDRNSYTADANGNITDGSGSSNRGFEEDSAFYVIMDKGTSNQLAGIGIGSATDATDPTTIDWEYGIYATDDGLYAVKGGVATEFADWGSDPLYTQRDFQDSVLDRLATPPSGVNDNRYLIIATATGDWVGKENYITEYQDAWVFIAPSEGMMTWVEDEDVFYVYSGSSWVIFDTGVDYINDIGDVVISGTPADNEILAYDTGTSKWINQTPSELGNIDLGSNYIESSAWRSNDYDVQIKPLNGSYLHVRNKADTAYKPVAADYFYSNATIHAIVDTDKFLVDDVKTIKYRTGAEVLSDIGASATGHGHVALDVSDFDTEVGNHTDVTANTTHRNTTTGNPHSLDNVDVGAKADFSENSAFNKDFAGTGVATTVSRVDHNHNTQLMIGSTNKAWVNMAFSGTNDTTITMSQWGGNFRNMGSDDCHPSFTLAGIAFSRGGKSLTITRILFQLVDADDSDYISRIRVWSDATIKFDSSVGWKAAQIGQVVLDITDCTPTQELMIYFDIVATTQAEFEMRGIQAECYYA